MAFSRNIMNPRSVAVRAAKAPVQKAIFRTARAGFVPSLLLGSLPAIGSELTSTPPDPALDLAMFSQSFGQYGYESFGESGALGDPVLTFTFLGVSAVLWVHRALTMETAQTYGTRKEEKGLSL